MHVVSAITAQSITALKPHEAFSTADLLFRLSLIVLLVLFGGLLAGLTIGFFSLDVTKLRILLRTGTPDERRQAALVLPIRYRPHLLLCTLLLANTIVNETLPVLMDPFMGTGIKAVITSTALIVLFGEIIPQAVCNQHALAIGASFAW
jgi:CBS domain containing-hemolysin-like protein